MDADEALDGELDSGVPSWSDDDSVDGEHFEDAEQREGEATPPPIRSEVGAPAELELEQGGT